MREEIVALNEMSFQLPKGWSKSTDIYELQNRHGMINNSNYVSLNGEVVSLFEVHKDPDEFFEYYNKQINHFGKTSYAFMQYCNIKAGDFIFPVYIIKIDDNNYNVQIFCNCGDCLACFMVTAHSYNEKITQMIKDNNVLKELVKFLRTIE